MSVYLVIFGKPRYLGLLNAPDSSIRPGQWIVLKTVRGSEIGLLGGFLSQEQENKYRTVCLEETNDEQTKGPEPMLQEVEFVSAATEEQLAEYHQRRSEEEGALVRARQLLRTHQLQMKLVDMEYTMDRKKLFFYFTSEQRIDFRAYVRDLAKEFRTRIEMRQIGVRDEAKAVRGIGPCGRPCCCSYWLHRFTPICIRMVKEQNLALNPTKISGICGRLMCCMAYEHNTYGELWKSLPNPGSKIKTPQGNYVLDGLDLRTETIRIRVPAGREISIPIQEFSDFRETVLRGEEWRNGSAEEPPRHAHPPVRKAPQPAKAELSDAQRNGKPSKPEKISIEEHLAGRKTDSRPPRKEREEAADTPKAGEAAPKKRNRKRRSASSQAVPHEGAQGTEQRRNEPRAEGEPGRRKPRPQGSEKPPRPAGESGGGQPKERENRRPPRHQASERHRDTGDEPVKTAPQQDGQEAEKPSTRRRRPRRRPSGSGGKPDAGSGQSGERREIPE